MDSPTLLEEERITYSRTTEEFITLGSITHSPLMTVVPSR